MGNKEERERAARTKRAYQSYGPDLFLMHARARRLAGPQEPLETSIYGLVARRQEELYAQLEEQD